MNDVELYIKRLMHESVKKILRTKQVTLNNGSLNEMARLNVDEYGAVPFPSNKFEIKIWSNDHNPPHFHVIVEGWNISFRISDGQILRVDNYGGSSKMYNYIVKNIPIWLKMKSVVAPLMTNQEYAMAAWRSAQS